MHHLLEIVQAFGIEKAMAELGLGFIDFGDLDTGAVAKRKQGPARRRRLVDRFGAKPNLMAIAARAKAQMLAGKIRARGSDGFFPHGCVKENSHG